MSASTEAQVPGQAVEAVRPPSPFRHYRHLTLELAISQFKLRYTQSVLGYLWSLVKPAMLFGIMYVVFDKLFHVNDNTPFYPIQLLLGIVTWTFFAECTATSMQAIASNGGLLRKAYFPRSILVIAASFTSLFTFVINLTLVFVIAVALRQIDVGLRIVAVVPLLIELYLLSLGLSLFLSALFVQYHDVGHLWEVVQQALFYGSGVMFSLTYVMQRTGVVAPAIRTARRQAAHPLATAAGRQQSDDPDHRGPAPRGGHAGGALDRGGGHVHTGRDPAGGQSLAGAGPLRDRARCAGHRSPHLPFAGAELRPEPVTQLR